MIKLFTTIHNAARQFWKNHISMYTLGINYEPKKKLNGKKKTLVHFKKKGI